MQAYSERFPNEMPCRIEIRLRDGRMLSKEVRDYPGFFTQPMTWDISLCRNSSDLAEPRATAPERRAVAGAISELENTHVSDLMRLRQASESLMDAKGGLCA